MLRTMHAAFFGLQREPFSLAPDPRFLFMSERHREALAHLLYGVRGGGGFVLLTGEIGAGKTTVTRCFLEQLPPHCVVAYIFNPCLSVIELLQTVCSEFGIPALPAGASVKAHVDALNQFLLHSHAQGRHALLVIDEAQALEPAVLEQLRLLTNLETAEKKLLQIMLIGQPELRTRLTEPGLEQLAQRVIARYHLGPLGAAETRQYVEHRLAVAGLQGPLPFDKSALDALHRLSGGVPRRINLLADRAMLGAYAGSRRLIDRRLLEGAAREVFDGTSTARPARPAQRGWHAGGWIAAGVALGLTAGAALVYSWRPPSPSPSPPPADVASASTPAADATAAPPPAVPASVMAADPQASAAAVAAAVPEVQDLGRLMAMAPIDEAIAWRELALRWNVAIGEGDPCVAALQAQLACYRGTRLDLQAARRLDRPAMLVLRDAEGPRVQVLLVALDDRYATLQVGNRRFQASLTELARLWRGDLATFWRLPPGWRSGAAVQDAGVQRWVQQQVSRALPQLAAQAPGDRVAAFQLQQGLPVDGVVGPLTVMRLNRVAAVDEPRLVAVER
jgi:general secretion pathway protein A